MTATHLQAVTVALIGNPNTGKSTLFNALAGVRQHVGNYPGVTVEKKEGRAEIGGRQFVFIDLPGTYSLAPRSPDEMVTVDVLLGRHGDRPPHVVLCIVDASNLERNLYLVSQVLELGRPVVLVVNMTDVAAAKGLKLNVARLRQQLGLPVVEMQAHRKQGLAELKTELARAANIGKAIEYTSPFPAEFQQEVAQLQQLAARQNGNTLPRYLLERLLLDAGGYLEQCRLPGIDEPLLAAVRAGRARLAAAGLPVPTVEAISRYAWVGETLAGVVARPAQRVVSWGDKLDVLLTHWFAGPVVFVAFMLVVFEALFSLGNQAIGLVDAGFGLLANWAGSVLPEGALNSLVTDGIIGGVGSVLTFLPQIFILFFFVALLEDCGYMARVAYLMDKLMSRVGLSGKSFIPLLSSFACAIPGIMAARVIENRRDRLITILVAPLMTCSARLPVYTLLIAAFIPPTRYLGGWLSLSTLVMVGLYLLGIVTAVCMAWALKRTILPGSTPPFVMEMPSYKIPSLRTVCYRMLTQGWAYVQRAGTLIFAVSVCIWAASYYPRDQEAVEGPMRARLAELESQVAAEPPPDTASAGENAPPEVSAAANELANLRHVVEGEYLRHSWLGRAGRFVEPVVRPLGWDWRIGCAVLASFPAREVVVGTLGVIYNVGEVDEKSEPLRQRLHQATWDGTNVPVFNTPVALSIMVFFALCAQCASTLVVMRRETNSWRWPAFTFVYMTTLAYVGAWITYHAGQWVLNHWGGSA